MQNIMVRGGGKWSAGEKNLSQEKNEKGKEKKEENYIKKGEKGLENLLGYKLKKISTSQST